MDEERLTQVNEIQEDKQDRNLRPQKIEDFIGQKDCKSNLEIFIEAAKLRNEP